MAFRKDTKQLHQPETLEILATSKIIDWITSQAKTDTFDLMYPKCAPKQIIDLSQKLETIRDYFKNTPGMIINNLLAEGRSSLSIMLHHKTGAPKHICGKINRWIEVFFTKNVTCLSIKIHEFYDCKESFIKNSHLLEGVVKLELYSDDISEPLGSQKCIELAELIKNLISLKYLELFSCSDEITRCILDNCKSLVSIVLHSYYYISNETFDVITQLPNLETVSLYGSLRDHMCLFPKLLDYKTQVLIDLSLRKQFEIKSFVITDHTKEEDFEVIKKYPMIEQLDYVALRVPILQESLHQYLQRLENLQVLRLYGFDFYDDQIKYNMIELLGNKIVDLRLLKVRNIDLQALKLINQMCPHLQSLGMIIDEPVSRKSNYSCISGTEENPVFKNLQNLYLKVERSTSFRFIPLNPSLEESFASFLLENSPNVETVHFDKINLTKDFLVKVLDKNPLRCLKELYVPRELDWLVINCIIENGLSPVVLICNKSQCSTERALIFS